MWAIAFGSSDQGQDPDPPPAAPAPLALRPSVAAAGAAGARPPAAIPDLFAAVAIVAAVVLLYRQVLRLWWTHDDLFNLHYVSEHRPWEYVFQPRIWQLLPWHLLTPLQFLSLHLDFWLFGADPRALYVHQLVAAALAFLAFYAVLRLWLPPAAATLGTGIALAGAPAASLVQLLMTRHYLEGLLLAALAIVLFVHGMSRLSRSSPAPPAPPPPPARQRLLDLSLLPLSALCYLAASLAKEVFVPLVLFFPLLAPGGAGRRLRLAAPHLGAFLFYLGWRLHMVGTLGGGYGWSVQAADLPRLAASLPLKLVRVMIGAAPRGGTLLLAVLAAGAVAACYRRQRAAAILLLAAVAAVAPILPASTEMQDRYAFPLWLVLAASLAFGCDRLAHGPRSAQVAAVVLAGLAVITALDVNRRSWARSYAAVERASVENRALLRLPAGEVLRHPVGPPASLHEIQWFRQAYLHQPAGGGWFFDDLFLCALPPAARVLEYDPRSSRVEDVTARAPRLRAAYCGALRGKAPLNVDLVLADGNLHWRLGPYASGNYSLVVADGQDAYPVPAAGGFQVPTLQAITLRVHYASPAGWHTYSPPLSVAAGRGAHVAYARNSESSWLKLLPGPSP
jgi:hypothetical protein